MGFGAGQIVYEDDLTDIKAVTYPKSVATIRVNNTLSNDPELASIPLDVGTYTVEAVLYFQVANVTPKIRTRWAFTGTWTSPMRMCHGPGSTNSSESDVVNPSTFRGYDATTQDAIYNKSVAGAYGAILEVCYNVVVTVAGLFSIQWAQVTTTAANVQINANSTVRVTKIRS